MNHWKCAIIESPYKGETEKNLAYLQRCILDCISRQEAPFASHQMYTSALDDQIEEQRALGIEAGLAWRNKADLIVFYVDYGWSTGMNLAKEKYDTEGIEYVIREIGPNPAAT